MNVFQEKSYRQALERIVTSRKHLDSRMRFSLLADQMRIQKSYLSKVIRGSANLSSDQLHLGCQYLGLNAEETRYLQLLLEHEKSGVQERKDAIGRQIERIQASQLESKKHLQAKEAASAADSGGLGYGEYYLDPVYQLVHMGLTIPRYRGDLKQLADDLGIDLKRVENALQVLSRLGIIAVKTPDPAQKKARAIIEVIQKQVHLPRESPFYRSWRAQLRLWALQRQLELSSKQAYTFSVVFSGDEETRAEIQAKFLEFLSWAEKRVGKAQPESLYQMNFDLFPWMSQ